MKWKIMNLMAIYHPPVSLKKRIASPQQLGLGNGTGQEKPFWVLLGIYPYRVYMETLQYSIFRCYGSLSLKKNKQKPKQNTKHWLLISKPLAMKSKWNNFIVWKTVLVKETVKWIAVQGAIFHCICFSKTNIWSEQFAVSKWK